MAVIKNMMVRAGADFSAFTTQSKKAAKSMREMQSGISRSCAGIKASVGGMKKLLGGLGVAVSIGATVSAARDAAEAYDAQAEAEMKLATVMRNTMGARNKEIQSVLDLCSAQQRLGIIGDEVQLAGAQELATYLTQTKTLKKLIPVMNDMAAQQYGYNVTAENTTTIATMLGKVMNGQVSALSRLGYTFSEAQEQILKYGNEEERAATLARVINQSVGGMNRALANTPTGRMQQLSNTLGDIKERFGECVRLIGVLLLPLLWRVADVLEKIANFANRAAVSLNKVFGSAASLTGWQTVSAGVGALTDDTESLTDGMTDAAAAAEKVKRTVASFDTLNILGGKDESQTSAAAASNAATAGSAGSGALSGLTDDLDDAKEGYGWLDKILPKIKDNLQAIKDTALAVGAGLLSWNVLKGFLPKIGEKGFAGALKKVLGIVTAVEGAVQLGLNSFRAWNNGVDLSNLQGMLGGTIALCSGLGVAFGNVGAGIGLLVGSGAMLVTGMKDWRTAGELTTAAFFDLEGGILGLGVGVSLLFGSWIPLVVAGIAGLGLAIYQYWDEFVEWLGGVNETLGEWWEGTITPAISAAIDWIIEGFQWVGTELGAIWQETLNLATEIGGSIRDFFVSAVNLITTTAQVAATLVKQHWEQLKAHTVATFTAIQTWVTTAITTAKTAIVTAVTQAKTTAVAQWNAMLASCKSIFTSLHAHITQTIQTATSYLASVSWYSLGVNLMQGFLNGLKSLMSTIWNEVVEFVRRCTEAVRNALGVHSPSKVFEEIGVMVDRGALKGLRSGMPEILEEATGMADGLVDAMTPAALDVSGAYEGLGRSFPTADGDVSYSGEESMYGVMNLLELLLDAVLAGRETSISIGEEEVFNAVVHANNRAINRTGVSPLRG